MQPLRFFMTTARERASSSYGGLCQRFQCRRTVNPVVHVWLPRMHGVKDHFVDIRPRGRADRAASVPSTNGAAHKRTFAAIWEPAIPAQFQHSIMRYPYPSDQHMVGIGNRFDGLHHFDGMVPMGFCGSSIPAAMAILQLYSLTSDGLIHRHLLPVGCYVNYDQVYHHQFLTLLRLTPTLHHKHHRGRAGILVTNTAFTG